jgi:hypothetical protein
MASPTPFGNFDDRMVCRLIDQRRVAPKDAKCAASAGIPFSSGNITNVQLWTFVDKLDDCVARV